MLEKFWCIENICEREVFGKRFSINNAHIFQINKKTAKLIYLKNNSTKRHQSTTKSKFGAENAHDKNKQKCLFFAKIESFKKVVLANKAKTTKMVLEFRINKNCLVPREKICQKNTSNLS